MPTLTASSTPQLVFNRVDCIRLRLLNTSPCTEKLSLQLRFTPRSQILPSHIDGLVLRPWVSVQIFHQTITLETLVDLTLPPPSPQWLHQSACKSNQKALTQCLHLCTPPPSQGLYVRGHALDHWWRLAQYSQEIWHTVAS